MKKQWTCALLALVGSGFALANTATIPASLLFRYAVPMTADAACTDGLEFTTPTVSSGTVEVNVEISFNSAGYSPAFCGDVTSHQQYSVLFLNVCIGSSRSNQTYCIHNTALSALSGSTAAGDPLLVNSISFQDCTSDNKSTIAGACSRRSSCTASGTNDGNAGVESFGSISCTPV